MTAGHVLEERRYEPFGAAIDARVLTASGYVVGAPDLVARDLNVLNKRSDVATAAPSGVLESPDPDLFPRTGTAHDTVTRWYGPQQAPAASAPAPAHINHAQGCWTMGAPP